jgi:catechol 2,3-dioxygenase-like lactoylglutathione lyase family enzyme
MTDERPFEIVALDHIVIRVGDLDRMVAFYRDVLGCPVERVLEEAAMVQLRAGASLIDLVDSQGPLGGDEPSPAAGSGRNMHHYCIRVSPFDGERVRAHLKAHGIRPGEVADRYGAEGMGKSLYFEDPEGNTVELKAPVG